MKILETPNLVQCGSRMIWSCSSEFKIPLKIPGQSLHHHPSFLPLLTGALFRTKVGARIAEIRWKKELPIKVGQFGLEEGGLFVGTPCCLHVALKPGPCLPTHLQCSWLRVCTYHMSLSRHIIYTIMYPKSMLGSCNTCNGYVYRIGNRDLPQRLIKYPNLVSPWYAWAYILPQWPKTSWYLENVRTL